MQISIVLPSYNSQAYLPKTLQSLLRQKFDGKFEVIVVDCSSGDVVEQLCREHGPVRFHHESTRFNPGTGRNIGARLAQGELMVFVDTDVSLDENALQAAWNYYQTGHQVFGGALELDTEVRADVAAYLEHYFFNHESQQGRPVCPRSNLSSALMLLNRQLFLDNGGFSDIPRMQDTELTERLIRNGHALSFCPHVVGRQIQDAPLAKVFRKILINGRNLYYIRYSKISKLRKLALFCLLPLITTFKVLRIIGRHLRYQSTHGRWITLGIAPLLGLSGAYWMFGLYESLLFGGGISAERD